MEKLRHQSCSELDQVNKLFVMISSEKFVFKKQKNNQITQQVVFHPNCTINYNAYIETPISVSSAMMGPVHTVQFIIQTIRASAAFKLETRRSSHITFSAVY